MPPVTVQQAFESALQHHQAGRLAEAEALYRQILALEPDHADARHLLGVVAHQVGRHELAAQLIGQAVVLDPGNAAAHSNLGEAFRAKGCLDEAIASYRRALELKPDYPEAHNNLGTALAEQRHYEEAAAAFRRAVELKADYTEAHKNLGSALKRLGRLEEAVGAYRRAVQADPGYAPGHYHLGNALKELGQLAEAITEYERAVELKPDWAEAQNNLGAALAAQLRFDEAMAVYGRALALKPDWPEIHTNLGNALRDRGQLAEAMATYRRALELKGDLAEAHNNLGIALAANGQLDEAVAAYRRALEGKPNYPEAENNLGNAFKDQGKLDEAVAAYGRALGPKPDYAEAHNNLGNALRDQGRLDEAIASYRRAVELHPAATWARSNLVYALHFDPSQDRQGIAEEQQRWSEQVSEPAKRFLRPHNNDRNPDRVLRIGYVSPDFRDQVVGRNVRPLFRWHDHGKFEIVCYSGGVPADKLTEEFRQGADRWRSTVGVADEALAEIIREDGVDILVDLTQHMSGSRLAMFARRPAPVQVSFAGYPESTGLEAIGCRISDGYLEAGGLESGSRTGGERTEGVSANRGGVQEDGERSAIVPYQGGSGVRRADLRSEWVFLIDSFWCYDPCGVEVTVNESPAKESGRITFGSLNNFCKINDAVLKLWARVLGAVKDSRLVLLTHVGSHRQRTVEFLEGEGIGADRVEFVALRPREAYLELYHHLDLALDPFPYGGHTTSLDALWMGVPVVSLAGERAVSRAGLSILSHLGLPELVAYSEEDCVKIAVDLARDLPRMAELRATLRSRMEASVLMDGARFARNIEAAYRAMWRQWCAD